MGNALTKFLFFLLAVFILLSVTSQFYNGVREEYRTETAVIHSSADKVTFKGVYIRSEEVIRKSYAGVLSYPCEDGNKVANGSVVAYVYDKEEDIEINRRIEALEDEIKVLQAAQNPGTVLTVEPSFIASQVSEKYQSLVTSLAKKDISDLKSQRDNLLTLMGIYQICVNKEENYDDRINELAAEAADLKTKQQTYKYAIESPDAGYFVSYTDGYENILKIESADTLTAEMIKDVIANERNVRENRSKSEIGKLVKGYNWKIAGIIDNSDSIYNPGDSVKLSFASTPDKVNAVIETLEETDDPKEWMMILRCDEMTFDLVRRRVERVEMTLNDFEGIKVPREALRFNKNNEKGCYVLWGQRVLFKKVDPIFEDSDYILSRLTSDENYVCVYDDIIIEGVDTAAFMANSDEIVTGVEPDESVTEPVYTRQETEASETEAPAASEESSQTESGASETEVSAAEEEIRFE
ncbi:MAG: HlyD family efflux transporter periplasmic adaptor subunit [Huintestinicola sp.]